MRGESAGSGSLPGKGTHKIVRILIVDNFLPWRQFVSSLFEKISGWQLVSEATSGLEGVQKAHEFLPDLVLLEVDLPELSGLETVRRIRQVTPDTKILMVSIYEDLEFAEAALRAGAHGYVCKTTAGRELVRAVEAVLRGRRFISSKLRDNIFAREAGL